MVQILLIRPGATNYDKEDRIQGNLDLPLSAEGNGEAARLAGELVNHGIEILYASPGQSAQQTARMLANTLDVKVKTLAALANLDQGLWQGMRVEEVRLKQPRVYRQWQEQPESVCPPGGEMLEHAATRVRGAMTRLLKRHKEGVIALVVPEPLASLVRQHFDHTEFGDLWKTSAEHGRWEILNIHPEAIAQG